MKPKKDVLVILAGSFREAADYAQRQKLKREEWAYVSTHFDLWGRRDVRVVRVGTFGLRTDALKIEEVLRIVGERPTEDTQSVREGGD